MRLLLLLVRLLFLPAVLLLLGFRGMLSCPSLPGHHQLCRVNTEAGSCPLLRVCTQWYLLSRKNQPDLSGLPAENLPSPVCCRDTVLSPPRRSYGFCTQLLRLPQQMTETATGYGGLDYQTSRPEIPRKPLHTRQGLASPRAPSGEGSRCRL